MIAAVLMRGSRIDDVLLLDEHIPAPLHARLVRAGYSIQQVHPHRVKPDALDEVVMPMLQGDLFAAVGS